MYKLKLSVLNIDHIQLYLVGESHLGTQLLIIKSNSKPICFERNGMKLLNNWEIALKVVNSHRIEQVNIIHETKFLLQKCASCTIMLSAKMIHFWSRISSALIHLPLLIFIHKWMIRVWFTYLYLFGHSNHFFYILASFGRFL